MLQYNYENAWLRQETRGKGCGAGGRGQGAGVVGALVDVAGGGRGDMSATHTLLYRLFVSMNMCCFQMKINKGKSESRSPSREI